ncbi:hypothetical protein L1049_006701 [Liquidambar formosana]|uniref:Ubiquitin-like protease family profile domain-containing protein n=1 Tax=Liquidambar formosana TaxID=63359 RepID=A0AAP0WRC1_LIQFO
MEAEKERKKPLELDWDKLLPSQDDDPPPDLVVTTTAAAAAVAANAEQHQEQQKQHSTTSTESQREEIALPSIPDRQLEESIERQKKNLNLGLKLPDKGEKIRVKIKQLEEERERRKLRRLDKDADICEKPTQSNSSITVGACNGFRGEDLPSQAPQQSTFGSHFGRCLDDTDCRTVNAFDKDLSYLGCERRKMKHGQSSLKGRQKTRQLPSQCPRNATVDKGQHILSNGDQKGRAITTLHHIGEDLSHCFSKKRDASHVLPPNDSRPRKGQTVVLVDEEESQLVETTGKGDKLDACLKETKIYYPSRDDPESVEICYSDIECLAPETFLTSTIMNFYIRCLQQPASPTERARSDYHFFNTYFYKKLKEAISYKGSDKKTFFMKFRRWWKGVNIFQKAYILLPIHEDLHWSLVIICIPDKEDESGPIILHLDSLGYHHSKKIFDDIKSYIREEWDYLNQEGAPPDLPIADRIWKHLPRRIDEKKISVPQQKNDYDCGLFVLFFMERFIEEAPERLKKKDLAMFGKQWFKSEEASGLRGKIREILKDEFRKASKDNCILKSPPLSSGGAPAGSIGHHKGYLTESGADVTPISSVL